MSLDGYVAGPTQDENHPLGLGGERLHEWVFATAAGRRMIGADGGTTGLDNTYLEQGDHGVGATIMGRNMFGPFRGAWQTDAWTGWWGDTPPYHHPVFVLTHYGRAPVAMHGGTTFHFVTGGIEAALEQAFDAAAGADVRLGGGAATVQEYLRAGLVDELHLALVPILLGGGERLFENLDGGPHGMELAGLTASDGVAHLTFVRQSGEGTTAG
jgi:dihydrofolate reductase